ncbi:hypothetical protein MY5147_008907 [Beauveria neobassiana]
METRLNNNSVRHHHRHSRSTPPSFSRSHTTARAPSRNSSCLFRSTAPPAPAPAPSPAPTAAAAARLSQHTRSHTTDGTLSHSCSSSSSSHFFRSAAAQHARSQSTPATMGETTTVLVGRSRKPFIVDRRLLCAASPFFRDQLQMPNRYASSSPPSSSSSSPRRSDASPAHLLHWALVRLHLFAAHLGLAPLQDLAMDALQDLYLCCDWDISPGVVTYLYTRCETRPPARLRRWALAMLAFSLAVADWHTTSSDDTRVVAATEAAAAAAAASATATDADARLRGLIGALPELAADYATHVKSMRRAALDMRFKNPQLRIPANALSNEKRAFGFRECSFHSHRRAVGQGACPHAASGLRRAETGSRLDLRTEEKVEDEDEGDEGDEGDEDDDDDDDDDTRQWEKEWADELMGWEWEDEGEDACVPTTSLRRPPRKGASGLI